ncbi:MAG: hypothetical protein JXB48_16870 [Candidatus Latescibacteria bacterium]|nr:hypothetical protein [Candidatus Latescibacterota bacterium]
MKRREFIKHGSTAASLSLLGYAQKKAEAATSGRPFITCRKDKKLIGVYCSIDEILDHPEYIDRLQEKLGCNVIILSAPGVNYPRDILKLAPFSPETNQWIGIGYSQEENKINLCAEEIHKRNMDIWLIGSGHYDRGNNDAFSPVDFNGMLLRNQTVPKYAIESSTALCFQKQRIINWQVNAYSWICNNHDIDALYLTHHRYNAPSIYSQLWGCTCADCRKAANRLGYDFDRMGKAMIKLETDLNTLTKERIKTMASLGFSLGDFIQAVTGGNDILDWIEFRAKAVTDSLSRVNRAIKTSTQGKCAFIIDTVGPTFSLLVGHDLKDFTGKVSDAYYPMAWVDYHYMSVPAAWAQALVERVPNLDERTALEAVYKFIGWDDIDLPRNSIADIHIGATRNEHSIEDFYSHFKKYVPGLMTHEYKHGALLNTNNYPSYQTVFPHFWGAEITEPLFDVIMDTGHDGYIFEISAQPFVNKPEKG